MGELGFIGGSGLPWRVKNQATTSPYRLARGAACPTPGSTTGQPLSSP